MWIFLEDATLNIVADDDHPGHLLVQTHHAHEIQRVFGEETAVTHRPMAPLPFVARLPRAQVAGVVSACIGYIDYSRFPNARIHAQSGRA